MKRLLWNWIISAAALGISAALLPNYVQMHNPLNVLWIAPLLGLVGVITGMLSWVIKLIAFPVNLLTLGCFGFIVSFLLYVLAIFTLMNGHQAPLAAYMSVNNFGGAAALAVVMAVVSGVLNIVIPVKKQERD